MIDCVFFAVVMSLMVSFSHEVSGMRSGTDLSQFLKVFLPTLVYSVIFVGILGKLKQDDQYLSSLNWADILQSLNAIHNITCAFDTDKTKLAKKTRPLRFL